MGLEGGPNTFAYSQNKPLTHIDPYGLLITSTLSGVSRDPIHPDDAGRISNFASAATLVAGGAAVAGSALAAGGPGTGAMVCKVAADVARDLKDPCRNAIVAAALGVAMCQGNMPNSLRRDLERRDEIRRASDLATRDSRARK